MMYSGVHTRDRAWGVLLLLTLVVTSCYESQEGCLDVYAKNYSVTADRMCEDCCSYPQVAINISSRNGEINIKKGDTLVDGSGNTFLLLDMRYALSGFYLDTGSKALQVRERASLSDRTSVVDDATIVDAFRYTFPIGTLGYEGSVRNIRYAAGLQEKHTAIGYLTSHRVEALRDTFARDGSYFSAWARIARGDNYTDTLTVYGKYGSKTHEVLVDTALVRGNGLTANLKLDMLQAWRGIDVSKSASNMLDGLNIKLEGL